MVDIWRIIWAKAALAFGLVPLEGLGVAVGLGRPAESGLDVVVVWAVVPLVTDPLLVTLVEVAVPVEVAKEAEKAPSSGDKILAMSILPNKYIIRV